MRARLVDPARRGWRSELRSATARGATAGEAIVRLLSVAAEYGWPEARQVAA